MYKTVEHWPTEITMVSSSIDTIYSWWSCIDTVVYWFNLTNASQLYIRWRFVSVMLLWGCVHYPMLQGSRGPRGPPGPVTQVSTPHISIYLYYKDSLDWFRAIKNYRRSSHQALQLSPALSLTAEWQMQGMRLPGLSWSSSPLPPPSVL